MQSFCKSLHPDDYQELGKWLYLYDALLESKVVPYMPNPHLHRRWEYGMAMEFLRAMGGPDKINAVLDVGGAGSLFAPIALASGYKVIVVDQDPCVAMLAGQARGIGLDNRDMAFYSNKDFFEWSVEGQINVDVVVSLSTIEHVPEDKKFFQKLIQHARRGLFLTTDFAMDGAIHHPGHLRTYSPHTLMELVQSIGDQYNWSLAGDPLWIDNGGWVMGYNFASLGVKLSS